MKSSNQENMTIIVQVDRNKRLAEDAVNSLEAAGLSECDVLHNLNLVMGSVAITAALEEVLQILREIEGVERVIVDMSLDEGVVF